MTHPRHCPYETLLYLNDLTVKAVKRRQRKTRQVLVVRSRRFRKSRNRCGMAMFVWLTLLFAQPYSPEYRNLQAEAMRGSSFAAPNTWQYATGHRWGFQTQGQWFGNARGLAAYYGSLQKTVSGDD